MNTPLSWVKAYVPELSCTAREYMDAMTLSGTKVEGYEELDKNLEKIVVGKILKIERHPDADKLIICQVQISEEGDQVQIVTGAPNVKEGDKVPVVLDGGRVAGSAHDNKPHPEGIKIKKGKLRGVESFGMMCSIDELGSSKEFYPDAAEDGIYILSDNENYKDAPIGSSVVELLGLNDVVVEYEVTSNRVDCFSIIGIAREAAATFRKPFVLPEIKATGNSENVQDMVSVEIKDKDLCKRYVGRVVKNIKIGPSPEWMQRRLAACGIRPINNIVDITNYVMEEYGQPMHAYDLSTIAGNKIVVRRANDGETFTTLDGQERKLDSSMLMICDAQKAIGIAGIMGGDNSKITDDVTAMLFEAACFDGTNIRLSGKKLGMRTDAQAKFEKGLDPNTAKLAIDRACELIEELGAGEVVGGYVDEYENVNEPVKVGYNPEKINKLLGTDISEEEMAGYFKMIDFEVDETNKELTIPTWRQDIHCLADVAEEVARFYGYDNIPTTLPKGSANGSLSLKLRMENIARNVAEQFGFSEAMTYSFESPKVFEKLRIEQEDSLRDAIVISNPLGEDYSIMRTSTLNGMLTSLATNYNRRNKDVRLYEIANIYIPKALPLTELPDERTQLTLGMFGAGDFFDLKGIVEEFLEKAGLRGLETYDPASKKPFLHPGRQANIIYDGTVIGYLGEVHPEVSETYGIGERVYIADIDMPEVVSRANFDIKYKGIAKYPAVTRDISMVMEKSIMVGQIEEVIRKCGGKLLEELRLFDVYEGSQIKEGYKSVAYSISFRANDRTLADQDVNTIMDKILKNLEKSGIELRK
ncbi:phenylalanine--tRNA ligase subunit beta [[Clostridium] polysaccharolyticum]|uniref:Phenylalanine--tRNA ligase beta subunit n=1 Tax=[Clostridium] polysaccharolyticum TaxID=29364 RepID=A0A1H9ZE92_9FIRM|nr:phenylalanine--tRNA ligase subunit beta [[Clostridium] polysaccharolyticum]SES79903.1 phenylalanyl-tRNA synthetase beta subunit [[Clostridium] polysaccharolyticum]